ncbi:helix-turn-helix domain-containing protein [Bradyrhizobium sp. HKCCYLR1023]|uniref:helix-turn-helix domain-containing protein n=1 Tax=Bradyrhizobium TaxID=374 RepID=UPI003EBDC172
MSRVRRTTVGNPTAKSLLLALADYANDGGASCFPSQELLRMQTELSVDTIQRQLRYLVAKGFVTVEKQRRGGHWASSNYTINLGKLTEEPETTRKSGVEPQVTADAAWCGMDHAAPCGTAEPQDAVRPSRKVRPKPSNDPFKISGKADAIARSLPADFQLDENSYDFALKQLGSVERVKRSVERFVDHFRHSGQLGHDWMARARRWINEDAERRDPGGRPRSDTRSACSASATSVEPPNEAAWEHVIRTYVKCGLWTRHVSAFGPDPSSPACRAPLHLLEQYGLRRAPQTAETCDVVPAFCST